MKLRQEEVELMKCLKKSIKTNDGQSNTRGRKGNFEVKEKEKVLFFDLDDTLIKCSGYFYDVEDRVADKFREYMDTYSRKQWKVLFNEQQWSNVEKHGYGPENFMISLMQVGSRILGYDFFKDNLDDFIKKEAQILFEAPIELIEGTEETIKCLHQKGYHMNIITKGKPEVQKRRIDDLKIKEYFEKYEIVKHKEKADYLNIIDKYDLNPDVCYMIGNSPKGDINEAKLAGFRTVYIPSEHTWQYEEEQIIEEGPKTIVLNNIAELKDILL